MLVVAAAAGAVLGALVAAPAIRLRGVYFALLTFGLAELFRSYVLVSGDLGQAYGLYGAKSFIPDDVAESLEGNLIGYYGAFALVALALVVYRVVNRGRLGLLLRAARESEPVARAMGVDVVRARLVVFVVSSAMLGLAGGFYGAFYKGVSPSIFDFGKLLLLFAMMVVGGMGSARGVLLGTALLLFVEQHWQQSGPPRLIAAGALMLAVTLFASRGLDGLPGQVRDWLSAGRARREPAEPDPLQGLLAEPGGGSDAPGVPPISGPAR
jgi:branched-chain amino acid transport system permease protein